LALGEDVPLHGGLDVFLRGARLEGEFGIECVKLEEITMGLAGRRAGAVVAGLCEIVVALVRTVVGLFTFGKILRESAEGGGQIIDNPVDPVARGCVRVVGDESKALRGGGRVAPGEGRGDVGAGAGELLGNGCAGGKVGAFELEGIGRRGLRGSADSCEEKQGEGKKESSGSHSRDFRTRRAGTEERGAEARVGRAESLAEPRW
jgi:hypothetical protein